MLRLINFSLCLQILPAIDKYEGLKALLLCTFGLSRRNCATHILHMDGLGDQKPSALMSEMLALMDGRLLFEQAFLEQMPDDIRLLLAGSDFAEPLQLAERADGQWLAKQQDSGYNWVSTSSHQQPRRDMQPSAAIAAPQPPAGDHGTRTGLCYSRFMRVLSGCCAPALCRFFWMSERSFQSLTSSPPIWISIARWWWLNPGVEVIRRSSQLHLLCLFLLHL